MRYYFFETRYSSKDKRDRLYPLPGQTFPDGTKVDETYHVQSPKTPGSSIWGNREDYPTGTRFCSSHLEEITTPNGARYYSVYPGGSFEQTPNPDFHPVSDDNNFNFAPNHRSEIMNIAYVRFITFGLQDDVNDVPEPKKTKAKANYVKSLPYDKDGKATPIVAKNQQDWKERYDDQLDSETEIIATWMRRVLAEMGITSMARRPRADVSVKQKLKDLYTTSETLDTIANKCRLENIMKTQKMGNTEMSIVANGPFEWYLDELTYEHKQCKETTVCSRDASNPFDVQETAMILATRANSVYGSFDDFKNPQTLAAVKTSMEKGWDASEMIIPEVIESKASLQELADAMATGAIPAPAVGPDPGKTLIGKIKANKSLACPKDKDGFHVDETYWLLLLRNLQVGQNTLLTGPTGSGKTELVKKLCEVTNTPLTIIPMGNITDPTEQLIGKLDLNPATGGTIFDWADFALAIQRPGVVLLDEVNRIPRYGSNALFSCLDSTRMLPAANAKSTDVREIKVNPKCVFFATANIGAEYAGTSEIDPALATRFLPMELKYLDEKNETAILVARTGIDGDDARNIALIATNIRKEKDQGLLERSISTRETLYAAELVRDGFSVEEALELVFLPLFERGATDLDPNSDRGKVRGIIASRFNKKN